MRNPDRIQEFCDRLAGVWYANCPDWRFGQLISNVLSTSKIDPFYLEEKDMLELFERYFDEWKKTTAT